MGDFSISINSRNVCNLSNKIDWVADYCLKTSFLVLLPNWVLKKIDILHCHGGLQMF
jgi:hypothetical protein